MHTTFQTELRRMRGLRNQAQFAEWIGVSRVTIARLEAGSRPSLDTGMKLVERGMDPAIVTAAAVDPASGRAA